MTRVIAALARRSIIGSIDAVSGKLIPEDQTPGELKYLEVYATTRRDIV
ncbi:MAG: hypothetical protein ISQ54_07235 [Candidatus Poseidonia sp.]|nr:hypothetical protein [Poseidonia sp.]